MWWVHQLEHEYWNVTVTEGLETNMSTKKTAEKNILGWTEAPSRLNEAVWNWTCCYWEPNLNYAFWINWRPCWCFKASSLLCLNPQVCLFLHNNVMRKYLFIKRKRCESFLESSADTPGKWEHHMNGPLTNRVLYQSLPTVVRLMSFVNTELLLLSANWKIDILPIQ